MMALRGGLRYHIALSEKEARTLCEALALASSESIGRAAAHRAALRVCALSGLGHVADSGHELAAEMDEDDAGRFEQLLLRLDALGG